MDISQTQRTVLRHFHDKNSRVMIPLISIAGCNILIRRINSQICSDHLAIGNKLFNNSLRLINRNGKPHSLNAFLGYFRTVNSYDFPICRHKSTTGIPRIDGRISLN